MKREKSFCYFSITLVFCSLFGQKYWVSNEITDHIKEYKCRHCGEEFTNTANGLLEKLTPKLKETNQVLAQIHERRKTIAFAKAS